MKKYGNFLFNRRVVISLLLCFCTLVVLMPCQIVRADTSSGCTVTMQYGKIIKESVGITNFDCSATFIDCEGGYSFVVEEVYDSYAQYRFGYVTTMKLNSPKCHFVQTSDLDNYGFIDETKSLNLYTAKNGVYVYYYNTVLQSPNTKELGRLGSTKSDLFYLYKYSGSSYDGYEVLSKYVGEGIKSDGLLIGGSDTNPTAVTNESIGYLQDVKLNLSYITPIKGDSIFETTNYQIYTDMIYNLKWNSKKTSTNYDLSSSYVQLYAKAEYRKSEFDDVTATDFIELGDYEKASKGKLKFSFMDLFKKSDNCKNAYLSDYPLSSADYKNGKLQACSVTSNIQYKFYIRVYKGTDKGPWLCVSEKGSHISNEFVNSGDDVKYNVSSGGLSSDGSFTPDGNVNENGTGTTGTGKDDEDADADTNANDKIQSKHDSSDNSVWDNLENLVSGISSVPIIIKDIFSFLPSWCLNVTATGFALMITVCVIRFIRGK